MSSDCYGQGGRDLHLGQRIVLGQKNERDGQSAVSSTSASPARQEQRFVLQNSQFSYQDVSQRRDGRVQQHQEVQPNQNLLRGEDKMAAAYQPQAASSMQLDSSPGSSPSLDGQSLYCTEVLPVLSPPRQSITGDVGGACDRDFGAANRGAGSQQVQYTIIITDPQLHQNSNGSSSSIQNTTSGATNILLNTLVQQQEQQQLQQHLAAASKANNNLIVATSTINNNNNLVVVPSKANKNTLTDQPTSNANLLINSSNVNNSNINSSSKLGSLLISNNNNNITNGRGFITGATAFPANLFVNGLSNALDGKSIQLANLTFTGNNKLPTAIIDRSGVEGGFVILNYSEPHLRAATATITNINQLVSVHRGVAESPNLVITNLPHNLNVETSGSSSSVHCQAGGASSIVYSEVDAGANSGSCSPHDGHIILDKTRGGISDIKQSNISSDSQSLTLPSKQQDSVPFSDSVSVGMHSRRTGPGSAHNAHPQHHQDSPLSSIPASSVSTASVSQSAMLSAGQPAMPAGIFRTGTDNMSSSQRFTGGSGSYVHAQYPSIYGIHGQSTGHLTTLQPYPTFFPGFGGSGSAGHSLSHGTLIPTTAQIHYPQVESYSAMLASMGSHVQHRNTQGPDRTLRVQGADVPVSQHASHFLPSAVHLSLPGIQYAGIQPTSHSRLSDRSASPGPAPAILNPPSTGTHPDPPPTRHLEKITNMKGGNGLHGRDVEVSREMLYRNSLSLHEDKPALSPNSYSSSGHGPKVSFDTVVKEYGGSNECPTGRADVYIRSSLSGKEGSLKHRILTRPTDFDMPDDFSKGSGSMHGINDVPLTKRPKLTGVGTPASAYGGLNCTTHSNEIQRLSNRHNAEPPAALHHSSTNNNTMDIRGTGAIRHLDNNIAEYHIPQHSPYQQPPHCDVSTDNGYKHKHYRSPSPITPPSFEEDNPSHLQYPSHFLKGSIIQLANGSLKRVEDLQTEDFVNSAEISSDLKVDSSTVVKIEEHPDSGTAMLSFSVGKHRVQVTVEATLEHPFFVFGQGWSSCSVSRTLTCYGLDCQRLNVGDVCISLTHKDVSLKAAETNLQQYHEQNSLSGPHNKSGTETLECQTAQIISGQSTPSSLSTTSFSSSSSSLLPSALKSEHTYTNIVPTPSSTSAAAARRLSQTELPPPVSNVVLVKKEGNSCLSRKRDSLNSHRAENELKDEVTSDEADESDSTLSQRSRRFTTPDHNTVKAEQEQERVKHVDTKMSLKTEDMLQANSLDNGRQ